MTPAARAQAAIDILDGFEQSGLPADRFIREFFRARRYAGSKDRAAIAERVFDIFRHRSEYRWRMRGETNRAAVIASLLREGEDPAALFTGGYGPGPLTAAESEAIANRPTEEPPAHIRGEYPHFLETELTRRFGEELADAMRALTERASVDLRVNILRARRADILPILRGEGFEAEQASFAPHGIRIASGKGAAALQQNALFKEGAFEFQDEAAQIAAALCNARPGQHVLDLAAGAGGKSLALAAAMQNEGKLVACDVRKGALDQLRDRGQRAGASIIAPRLVSELRNETFDIVLLDTPCSGTGTWRRQPEQRWRLTPERLDELNATQDQLLDQAARHTKPRGRLVYATCSILPRENEDRVAAFLARHSNFGVIPATFAWRESITADPPLGLAEFFTASPHKTGTDGFFAAIMERA
ncbi:MAG: RsmB/NOP family class I SAM-dependent RNA methyltransferase [Alphaproteobacteria bacterium]|nr:RsmB/NOP family class I SAM-dependent RNA methyltransferase [Alphaproteobacteria bacterium]MBL7097238.1 RsmB/NOP family class I SAM-dependent RNA methyltransferase [Alphaproteobacteria bacterium]